MTSKLSRFPGHNVFSVLEKHCQEERITLVRLFREMFGRKGSVTSDEFAKAVRTLAPLVSWFEADELANALLSNSQITSHALPAYAAQLNRFTALANDHIFPIWLTERSDFQEHFPRLQGEGESNGPSVLLVEAAARLPSEDRQPRDTEIILNWLRAHDCLSHIPAARLMRLCDRLKVRDIDAGTTACVQGDIGDCYYVILTGEFDVVIDGIRVATLHMGHGFGEKALETGITRSATVRSRVPSKVMVAAAVDYRRAIAITQIQDFEATFSVLTNHCPVLQHCTLSRLRVLAAISQKLLYRSNQLVFEPETPANMLYIVVHGSVALKRKIRIAPTAEQKQMARRVLAKTPRSSFHVVLTLEKLSEGGVFGEDVALEHQMFSYYAYAQTETLLAIIDRERAISAFASDKGEALARLKEARKELYMDDKSLAYSYMAAAEAQAVKTQLSNESYETFMQARPPASARPKSASPRLIRTQMSNNLSVDRLDTINDLESRLVDEHNMVTMRIIESAQKRQLQLKL